MRSPANARAAYKSAPQLTHIELTWREGSIEHWLRFGHPVEEHRLDRYRRIASFAPDSVFAFVRWASNDFGTVISRIDIARTVHPGEAYQTLPFVRCGGELLLSIHGWLKVEKVLHAIDAVEALAVDPADAAPEHWRHVHNRLTVGQEPRRYALDQHRAWLNLLRHAVEILPTPTKRDRRMDGWSPAYDRRKSPTMDAVMDGAMTDRAPDKWAGARALALMLKSHGLTGTTALTIIAMLASVALVVAPAWSRPDIRFIWNASASVPVGLYRIVPADRLDVTDLAVVTLPDELAGFLDQRGYLPRGVPLIKRVLALGGTEICRHGARITAYGAAYGKVRERDGQGRPLPVWQGCRMLGEGDAFFMNWDSPDSLDSRYFGPLSLSSVIGRAIPVWTDEDGDGRFRWSAPTHCTAPTKHGQKENHNAREDL